MLNQSEIDLYAAELEDLVKRLNRALDEEAVARAVGNYRRVAAAASRAAGAADEIAARLRRFVEEI